MSSPRFSSVDDYLDSLDPTREATLRSVIEFVLGDFAQLDVKISWNVPQIHRDGEYVFGVSAAKNHLSLAPWSSDVIDDYKDRLETENYVVRKNLFQIPVDWEVDEGLLRDLVLARLAELDA